MGQYYCWNRTYDTLTGRWTTPDPAATPWANLSDYFGPTSSNDPSGLGLFGNTIFADKVFDSSGQIRPDVSNSDMCDLVDKYGSFLWGNCQGNGSSEFDHCLGFEDRQALVAASAHLKKNGVDCEKYKIALPGYGIERRCPYRGGDLGGDANSQPDDVSDPTNPGGILRRAGPAGSGLPIPHVGGPPPYKVPIPQPWRFDPFPFDPIKIFDPPLGVPGVHIGPLDDPFEPPESVFWPRRGVNGHEEPKPFGGGVLGLKLDSARFRIFGGISFGPYTGGSIMDDVLKFRYPSGKDIGFKLKIGFKFR